MHPHPFLGHARERPRTFPLRLSYRWYCTVVRAFPFLGHGQWGWGRSPLRCCCYATAIAACFLFVGPFLGGAYGWKTVDCSMTLAAAIGPISPSNVSPYCIVISSSPSSLLLVLPLLLLFVLSSYLVVVVVVQKNCTLSCRHCCCRPAKLRDVRARAVLQR